MTDTITKEALRDLFDNDYIPLVVLDEHWHTGTPNHSWRCGIVRCGQATYPAFTYWRVTDDTIAFNVPALRVRVYCGTPTRAKQRLAAFDNSGEYGPLTIQLAIDDARIEPVRPQRGGEVTTPARRSGMRRAHAVRSRTQRRERSTV